MIYINDNTKERISSWNDNSMYVLTDFDRTITVGNSDSSWSILSKSDLVPKEYVSERNAYFDYYRPIEIDETLDYETKNRLMSEWWNKHISLFIKYQTSEEVINKAARDMRVMAFRDGARDFLIDMQKRNIPVIIISAGIGNFIEQFLIKNDCNFDNIHIVANFIKFENGVAAGVSDNIIHSLNKNEVSLPADIKAIIAGRNNIVLLGDQVSDIRMASEENRSVALKIGFLEEKQEENMEVFKESFDIVCTNNTSYTDLMFELNGFRFSVEQNTRKY